MPYTDPEKKKQYMKAYNKQWYANNKGPRNLVGKAVNNKRNLRLQKKRWLFARMGGACERCGADEIEVSENELSVEIITDPALIEQIRLDLGNAGYKIESADIIKIPQNTIELDDQSAIVTLRMLEKLDELDDVSKIYSNVGFSDSVIAAVNE